MVLVTKDSGKIAQPILALLLLVLGINTDDHYAALAANDLALLADRLYRRSYLHNGNTSFWQNSPLARHTSIFDTEIP